MKNIIIIALLIVVLGLGIWIGTGSEEASLEEGNGHETEENTNLSEVLSSNSERSYGSAVITTDANYRYISSDGLPNHETGNFPNSGNPNSISEQDHDFRVALKPEYKATATAVQLPGVALNGIPLEPGTAEAFNNDPSTGWVSEAFVDGVGGLGIDWSNAHVQPNGTYHYHAVPEGLLESALEDQEGDLIHLGWAADGFPIYYSQSNAYSPSYQLKSGTRPSGPGGAYDGTYTQDFEYVEDLGDLDDCNGIEIDGQYLYLITSEFPVISRCLHGEPDPSFASGPGPGAGAPNQQGPSQGSRPPRR